jgi:redox-sensing transcriptional repressor
VCIIGAGKIGTALARYEAFATRGFYVKAIYDSDPAKVGMPVDSLSVRDIGRIEQDTAKEGFDIAVLAIPPEYAQAVTDRVTRAGIKAILNFAPIRLAVPHDVTVRTVNMALELEGLSFALTNRGND